MKSVRKTLAALTAAVTAAALFAACGSSSSSASFGVSSASTSASFGTSSAAASGSAASGSAASSSSEAFDYSAQLDENGHWVGVKALDYVTLPDNYAGLTIPADVHTITDSAVDSQVGTYQSQFKTTNQITDRAVASDDTINIDYDGKIDGAAFDGGTATGQTVTSSSLVDGFFSQLVGHKPGETLDITVTFPSDYETASLQGKEAVFTVTINYISETVLPDVTDEWVNSNLSSSYGWTTVSEMREGIRASQQKSAIRSNVLTQVQDTSTVSEVPQTIVDYQTANEINYVTVMASYYGVDVSTMLSYYYSVTSVDDFKTQYADTIKKSCEQYLILQAIAEKENITVTTDDISAYFQENLGTSDYTTYSDYYGINYITMAVLNNKVVTFLVDHATLG